MSRARTILLNFYAIFIVFTGLAQAPPNKYAWQVSHDPANELINRIATKEGYERMPSPAGSFASWLSHLPLKKGKPTVQLYDGRAKGNQGVHYAVIDIETGKKDLQQCADAVMRLRAEYLYATNQFDKIHFNYTSGFNCNYSKWALGYRPVVEGNKVHWELKAKPDSAYASFRKYLDNIFTYCGTKSLSLELKKKDISEIQAGDVFIHGGFPGHAVLVMDVAQHPRTGEKIFLLAQSYMPAQDMHILVNDDKKMSPWYSNRITGKLETPEWTFEVSELMSF